MSTIHFFVKGIAPEKLKSGEKFTPFDDSTHPTNTPAKPFSHLQQVFSQISKDTRLRKDLDKKATPYVVNVWLGRGTHFFYTCNIDSGEANT